MTDRPDNSFNPLAPDVLIRAAADGELTPEQTRALETLRSSDASIDAQIDFETQLRQRVGEAMREPAHAPAALRADVESLFADERATVGPAATRSRAFWAGRAGWLAAAAAILIVASVVTLIQSPPPSSSGPVVAGAPAAGGHFLNASNFIVEEHNRCSPFERYFDRKMNIRDVADVTEMVVNLLGAPPTRIELDDAGYQFAGMGRCSVPGSGASVHMIYRPLDDSQGAVSLFIQKATGGAFEDDVRYRIQTESGGPVLIWRDGGLIYYLFCPDAAPQDALTDLLRAPTRELPA